MIAKEKTLFEISSGWDFNLTEHTRYNTTMRDYFVQILANRKYKNKDIAKMIDKDSSSIAAAKKRFRTFYEIEPAYRNKFDEIEMRYTKREMKLLKK